MTATRVIAVTLFVWALALGAVWLIVTDRILEGGARPVRPGVADAALRRTGTSGFGLHCSALSVRVFGCEEAPGPAGRCVDRTPGPEKICSSR